MIWWLYPRQLVTRCDIVNASTARLLLLPFPPAHPTSPRCRIAMCADHWEQTALSLLSLPLGNAPLFAEEIPRKISLVGCG